MNPVYVGGRKMFCSKCGTQLSDTAVFCNKCGNTIQKSENHMVKEKYSSKIRIVLIGIVCILICILVILAITKNMSNTNEEENRKMDGGKSSIYGTWTDDSQEENDLDEARSKLYGAWSDKEGNLTITFNDDNTVRVSGLGDSFGVELFTFTEEDDDTFQLKAYTDNAMLQKVGLNMDYKISGNTMVVTIAGQEFHLKKDD